MLKIEKLGVIHSLICTFILARVLWCLLSANELLNILYFNIFILIYFNILILNVLPKDINFVYLNRTDV